MSDRQAIEDAYAHARSQYAALGVDTDEVLRRLDAIPISLHCWQTDDVGGFETPDSVLSGGGIQVTGNYRGRARNIGQVRQDLEQVMRLVPGKQRVSLHAIYGDFQGERVDRDRIEPRHFQSWIDWARKETAGLDFNPTCFSHPMAADGFTLSSKDEKVRRFWIEHVLRTREIAAEMGRQLGTPAVNNIWIPDGSKDVPMDRMAHRRLLKESLDEVLARRFPREQLLDAVESKLFGIGSEAMTVGSHEFYLAYAAQRKGLLLCLDNGHFHPTEQVGDKISSVLLFVDELLLHMTRSVRWDSDHVVTFNDETQMIAQEIVRAGALDRVHVGLDYFDASVNRIGAYVTGVRAAQCAFLYALLEPTARLREHEESGRHFQRLALLEVLKTKPFGAVYDYYCLSGGAPVGEEYLREVETYEAEELARR